MSHAAQETNSSEHAETIQMTRLHWTRREREAVSSLPLTAFDNMPNSNGMMVDVQALSATISVAVSQEVQKALEQVPQALQPTTSASGQNGIWTRDLRISNPAL